ncbi:unnamed protein product [Sphagnum troendelagicum]|uniref:Secreted protein n=1 Tax=Sphagnum troendelagicum TaxID=128251 RepID=A0ABP0U8C2_9BRYO
MLDAAHHAGLLLQHITNTCRQAMAIAQVQLELRRHSFRSVIVRHHIRLDHHLLVRRLNRHLVLLLGYERADAINKVVMNHWRGVARAFAKFITRHDASMHDPIVVDHVQGVSTVRRLCGIVRPNVSGECNVPIINEVLAQDDL